LARKLEIMDNPHVLSTTFHAPEAKEEDGEEKKKNFVS
jgi:hypothetical protein